MTTTKRTGAVIIGAGQAGLAMSRCLVDRGIDHVVLDRGRVAERWRSERWDSLRLLTPNWQSRLPGFRYSGPDPSGYMTMPEVIAYFERYAWSFSAPIEPNSAVLEVTARHEGFRVITARGAWQAPAVVIATGHCDVPHIPAAASALPRRLAQLTASSYRNPAQLPPGGVLIVGASATGIQLADEIHASGRPVTLAVGAHTRMPRQYRGRDIMWWLDKAGILGEASDQVYDVDISRDQPSLQLVGRPDHASLNLQILQERGVRVVGRLLAAQGGRVAFADDLITTTVAADVKLAALLRRIDEFAEQRDRFQAFEPPEPFQPIWMTFTDAPTALHLSAERINTVVWATGYRRQYPWLRIPVLDARGEIRHDGGITGMPGLYVIGLHFLRRRNSSFIDGVGADAAALSAHLAAHVTRCDRAIA